MTPLLERFELLAVAGAGGMGTVHRALDRATGATVAVKVLTSTGRAEVERFVREGELLSELAHPSIVRYVAHGVTAGGEPYLAMEWLEGEDLSARLARGPLPLEDAIAVAERVASALAVAHARGVVHRDVKPSNIFLAGGSPRDARVLDFGIARVAGGVHATRTGMVVGTPGYMAPEQARGDSGIDARADVFSLGCVLYECIAGVPAFRADNLLALLARILLDDPQPLAALTAVPPAVDALVARLLAKDPEARPRDGAALEVALSRVLVETAVPPSAPVLGASEQEWASLVFARNAGRVVPAHADTLAPGERPTHERVAAAIEALGARVERLVDGTLVAQLPAAGSPRDVASRAARCALGAQRALPADAQVVCVTGRGVRSARVPLGGVIDQAAALLSLGRSVEGPRIDATTAGLLDNRFSIGGDEHSLTLRAELGPEEAPRRLLGQPSPCVGRDRELGTLVGLFDECAAESVARAVLLTASPGAGKSRLRTELLARLAARPDLASPWIARADITRAGSPNAMLAQLVRHAARLAEDEPLEVQRRKLSARVAQGLEPQAARRVAAFLGELVSVPFDVADAPALVVARRDPVALGDQIAAAWDEFLEAELRLGPRVLVLEDLHWGDLPTVRACDRALRRFKSAPLFILATARPEVHDAFPGLWAGRDVQELRLVPLSPRASERLVRAALGAGRSDDVVRGIVARAEGNAFVLEELVRAAASERAGTLPDTVLAMTGARLASLDDTCRRALRAASVFGEVFWRGGVEALTGQPDVERALARLVDAEVLETRVGGRFAGERELYFRHALLREAAYATLTPDDLATGHRLAAAWLARAGEHDPVTLAEHHERGGEKTAAAMHYARAAETALEGNDFDAVVRYATRALAGGLEVDGRATCMRLIADAEQWRGCYAEALVAAAEAALLEPVGSAGWYRAHMLEGIALQRLMRTHEMIPLAACVRDAVPEPAAHAIRIEVLVRFAMRLQFFEQSESASGLLDRVDESSAGVADLAGLGWLEAARGVRAHARGDLPVYLEHIERAAEMLRAAGSVRDAISQLDDAGWWWVHRGRPDIGAARMRSVIEESQRLGLRRVEMNARFGSVWAQLMAGRAPAALAEARALVADPASARGDRTGAATFLGWALQMNGAHVEALEVSATVLSELSLGSGYWRLLKSVEIAALVPLGRLADARLAGDELERELRRRTSAPHFDTEGWAELGQLRLTLGDVPAATEAARAALRCSRALVAGFSDRAAAAEALRAVSHHRKASALARAVGLAPDGGE